MKASIALSSPLALLLIQALLLRNGGGKPLFVNQIEVSADAAQVANGGADRGFPRSVILDKDVDPELDPTIGVSKMSFEALTSIRAPNRRARPGFFAGFAASPNPEPAPPQA